MTFRLSPLILTLLLVGACDGSDGTREVPPPTTGTLRLTTTTGGADPDADGYTLFATDLPAVSIGSNATVSVDVAPGRYLTLLTGIADNCQLAVPDTVDVVAGVITPVALPVSCTTARTDLRVTVQTTGEDLDPSGYVVTVDGDLTVPVPSNGQVDLKAANGLRVISLGDRASNCSITGGPAGGVALPREQVTEVSFTVVCVHTPRIAFTFSSGTYTINPDSTGWSRIGPGAYPQWSPNGRQLLSSYQGTPVIMNTDGTGVHQVSLSGGIIAGANWSPDGSRISVAMRPVPGSVTMFVVDTNGANLRQISFGASYDQQPEWAPSGDRIVFSRGLAFDGGLWIARTDGSGESLLTPGTNFGPRWSPDGSRIAFMAPDSTAPLGAYGTRVMLMNADGSNRHSLTSFPGAGQYTAGLGWTARGDSLVVSTGTTLFTVDAATGGQTPAKNLSGVPHFAWRN